MDAEAKYWKDKWTECIQEINLLGRLYRRVLEDEMKGKGKKKSKKGC